MPFQKVGNQMTMGYEDKGTSGGYESVSMNDAGSQRSARETECCANEAAINAKTNMGFQSPTVAPYAGGGK